MKLATRSLAALARGLLFAGAAMAAGPGGYPTKPVKVVVPFAPAGPTDVMARLIAQKLSEASGQKFYVENHAGAGGNTRHDRGGKIAAPTATPSLFVSSSFVVNPSLYAKDPYDPFKDFAPVTMAAEIAEHPGRTSDRFRPRP